MEVLPSNQSNQILTLLICSITEHDDGVQQEIKALAIDTVQK